MKIWSNTKTLDGLIDDLDFTLEKSVAEVALIGGKPISLEEFPRLRGIFKTGVGRDNVPETEARKRSIPCGFPTGETCNIIFEETANFACHCVLRCLYAEIGDFDAWTKHDRPALGTRELLVLGTGNIGSRVVRKMEGFLKVSAFDALTHREGDLEPMVRRADCISLHLPLVSGTRGFFGKKKLGWMKNGAALVNTARGPVVDENDLFEELSTGRIRAAFDVFWEEPYRGKLTALPPDRFLVSPHVASTCREFLIATAADFRRFLNTLDSQ